MQSSVTPFGIFCSNHFPAFRLVPVWLATSLSSLFPAGRHAISRPCHGRVANGHFQATVVSRAGTAKTHRMAAEQPILVRGFSSSSLFSHGWIAMPADRCQSGQAISHKQWASVLQPALFPPAFDVPLRLPALTCCPRLACNFARSHPCPKDASPPSIVYASADVAECRSWVARGTASQRIVNAAISMVALSYDISGENRNEPERREH